MFAADRVRHVRRVDLVLRPIAVGPDRLVEPVDLFTALVERRPRPAPPAGGPVVDLGDDAGVKRRFVPRNTVLEVTLVRPEHVHLLEPLGRPVPVAAEDDARVPELRPGDRVDVPDPRGIDLDESVRVRRGLVPEAIGGPSKPDVSPRVSVPGPQEEVLTRRIPICDPATRGPERVVE